MNRAKMHKELLAQVNQESSVAVEKVERYLAMAVLVSKLTKVAAKEPMITVKNGSQEYIKANPALAEVNRLNTSLIALGKDMGLTSPPPIVNDKDGEGDDGGLV